MQYGEKLNRNDYKLVNMNIYEIQNLPLVAEIQALSFYNESKQNKINIIQ